MWRVLGRGGVVIAWGLSRHRLAEDERSFVVPDFVEARFDRADRACSMVNTNVNLGHNYRNIPYAYKVTYSQGYPCL
eukprot:COSAG05_NODE_716_length_7804_cov_2.669825_9_plen_77_part_00